MKHKYLENDAHMFIELYFLPLSNSLKQQHTYSHCSWLSSESKELEFILKIFSFICIHLRLELYAQAKIYSRFMGATAMLNYIGIGIVCIQPNLSPVR